GIFSPVHENASSAPMHSDASNNGTSGATATIGSATVGCASVGVSVTAAPLAIPSAATSGSSIASASGSAIGSASGSAGAVGAAGSGLRHQPAALALPRVPPRHQPLMNK